MEVTHLKARYTYTAVKSDEISFKKKDYLLLDSKPAKGWWKVRNPKTGATGLAPSNYLAIVAAPKEEEIRESVKPPVMPAPSWEDDGSRESILPPIDPAPAWEEEEGSVFDSLMCGSVNEDNWEKRALEAEKQLDELLRAVEEDRKTRNKVLREADEKVAQSEARARKLERQLAHMEEAFKLEKEERDKKEAAKTELWKKQLEAAEEKARALATKEVQSEENVKVRLSEEIEQLKRTVSRLEKEKKDIKAENSRKSSAFEDMFSEERELHDQTTQRCAELTEMYETARKLVKDLEEKLSKSQRDTISKSKDLKELQNKTKRMAELFKKQKQEMEQKLAAMGKGEKAETSKVSELEAKILLEKQENERLRIEIRALKKAEEQRQVTEVYEVSPPSFLPSAPAPPPLNRPAEKKDVPPKTPEKRNVPKQQTPKTALTTVKRPSRSRLDNVVAKIRTSQREDGIEFKPCRSNVVDDDLSPISESEAAVIFRRTNQVIKQSKHFSKGFSDLDEMHAAFKDGILLCVHLSLLCPKDIDIRAMNSTIDDDRDRQENFSLWIGSARMAGARFPRTITKETLKTANKAVMISCLWQNIKCCYAARFEREPTVKSFVAKCSGVSVDQVRDEWGSNKILWTWVNGHLKTINQETVKVFADFSDSTAFIFLLDILFKTGTKALSISNNAERAVAMMQLAEKAGCKASASPKGISAGHGRSCYALIGEIFSASLIK